MVTFFHNPDESVLNPTTDQILANCIDVDSPKEARLYREAYLEWHKNRSKIKNFGTEIHDRNDIYWEYISAKITRANLLSFIKRTVVDQSRRDKLIELFDLKTIPVKPVHFERQVHSA